MPKVPYTKPALDYSTQLQELKIRGLIVKNDAKAFHLLENIGYYRLSGYWYPMLAQPKTVHLFKPDSTFEGVFELYCFDRELRKVLMGELEKIEVAVRSRMIYVLSHQYGAFWYTNSALFASHKDYTKTLVKIQSEYSRTDEKFIVDFRAKYSDPMPPSWMMLELTSFGSLSMLYKNIGSVRDKRDIARYFKLDNKTFESWLHSIVYIRNVCAHHGRLWNRIMRISPRIPLTPSLPWITITTLPNLVAGGAPQNLNNRTYFFLSMVLYLLNTINPRHTFKEKLNQLLKKCPNVDVHAMGFPIGWEREPLWDWTGM